MTLRSRLLVLLCATACLAGAGFATTAQAATTAWAPVAASGPTNLPPLQSETQRLGVDAEGGTFKLTVHHVAARGTATLSTSTEVLSGVAISTGAFAVGQGIEGVGIPAGTTITAVGSGTLTLSARPELNGFGVALVATDGTTEPTPPISYDAPAKTSEGLGSVEAALNSLSLINAGGGSVRVLGGPGNKNSDHPYFITFDGGPLADTDVAQLGADGGALSGSNQSATVITTVPGGAGTTDIAVYAQNVGALSSSSSEAISISVSLPAGVTTTGTPEGPFAFEYWSCPAGAGQSAFTCTGTGPGTKAVGPGLPTTALMVPVKVGAGAISGEPVKVSVSGGGAIGTAEYEMPLTISAAPAPPGIQSFTAGAYDENGVLDTRAGAHPANASTAIFVNSKRTLTGQLAPSGEPKDIMVDLPPGFLGNPTAVPACPETTAYSNCPTDSIAGIVAPRVGGIDGVGIGNGIVPVVNAEAPFGYPAKFRFQASGFGAALLPVNVIAELRSDGDYGITAGSPNTPQIVSVFGTFFDFWGAPAEEGHDTQRCFLGVELGCSGGVHSTAPDTAFLTSATNCAEEALNPPLTTLNINTWQHPAEIFSRSVTVPAVTGCDQLEFNKSTPGHPGVNFTFEPSDTRSDSPASFRTELTVPAEGLTTPSLRTTPEIKTSIVKLPQGVSLNAAGADGLGSCSEQEIGLKNEINPATGLPIPLAMPNPLRFTKDPNQCPNSAKIGTGELKSALLTETLQGNLYLAAQGNANPFGSLFAVYLVIENPARGVFIKLPGEVEVDKGTGQVSVNFYNLPQLPFTSLKLTLKGGNRSALASPTTCGEYTTTATNTPWSAPESGPPTESSNGFEINQGPSGGPCAPTPQARPFDLGWKASGSSTVAGGANPLNFQITRPDGSQELESLELTTPPGLSASLKGIPYCSQAQIAQIEQRTGKEEQANPACPSASQVGTAITGAGAGPTPFFTGGKLYLSGPYKGAPLSVVAVTPAVAGPFDLGNVVVRSALIINRQSAQVTAKTDPIPQFLDGVQLRIRDVRIFLDRKDWTLNPTSCDASSVDLVAHGNSGALANRTARFQVAGCDKLNFAPKLSAKVIGGTKRGDHPAFTAELNYPPGAGYANIKDVQVALPHSEFLEQSHINTICTRPQAAAHQCPAGSIYGYAEATTPLLDGKLTGPVFLKSSDHKLPDLAIALKGPDAQPIEVEFQGRIDSVKGQIRNTIEGLPDVPVSSFTLKMKGGKKGLLVNSRNLCSGKPGRMTVHMVAQNNKRSDTRPLLQNSCRAAKKHKKHHKRQQRHGRLSRLIAGGW
jgi:hypothetical protein